MYIFRRDASNCVVTGQSVYPSKHGFIEDDNTGAQVVGFDVVAVRSYPVRLVSLGAKLWRRSYHKVWARMQSVQVCCE